MIVAGQQVAQRRDPVTSLATGTPGAEVAPRVRKACAGQEEGMSEAEELSTFVEGGDEYELRANEERSTYTLRYKTEDQIVTLEGEALEAFLKEYDLIKVQYPQYGADQRLAQIWDQGGYSWLAAGQAEEEG
jgi:hypothetical protein